MRRPLRGALFFALLFLPGCFNPKLIGSLSVTLRPQETNQWCWAAGGEMCMDFLGTNVAQCDEANKRLGRLDCCNSPTPTACIQPGWPEFEKYDFSVKTTPWGTALTWEQLKDEIDGDKKPFCFSWGWTGGGGHLMVAYGYSTVAGVNYVAVNNPWPPNVGTDQVIPYDKFVSLAGDHVHWIDHYDITKN